MCDTQKDWLMAIQYQADVKTLAAISLVAESVIALAVSPKITSESEIE